MTLNRRYLSAAHAFGLLLALGACSSVPDAANPAHWYRSTVDYFSGDDAEAEKKRKQEAERQKQRQARAQAQTQAQPQPQAQASPPAEDGQAKRESETGDVAERLARPAGRGLLADTGGRSRYATAVPRQAEDPGAPPSRAAQQAAAPAAAVEPPPASAPRAAVSATATPPAPTPPPAPVAAPAPPPPRPAREVAAAPPSRPSAPKPAQEQAPAASSPPPSPMPAQTAAQPPAAAPPPVPPRAVTVEETYIASLAQQTRLPSAVAAGTPGVADTLIISSEGLQTVGRAPPPGGPAPAAQAPAADKGQRTLGVALKPAGSIGGINGSQMVNVATIQFADGSSRLDEEARRIIGQVAKFHGEKGGRLQVVGHASMRTKPMDPERHAKVNEGISIARANAVAGQLARLGVKRDAVVVVARGDTEPAYYEIMGTGEAGNRRVEIYLESQP